MHIYLLYPNGYLNIHKITLIIEYDQNEPTKNEWNNYPAENSLKNMKSGLFIKKNRVKFSKCNIRGIYFLTFSAIDSLSFITRF